MLLCSSDASLWGMSPTHREVAAGLSRHDAADIRDRPDSGDRRWRPPGLIGSPHAAARTGPTTQCGEGSGLHPMIAKTSRRAGVGPSGGYGTKSGGNTAIRHPFAAGVMVSSAPVARIAEEFAGPKRESRSENALNTVEDRMQHRLASVAMYTGLVVAGLVGGTALPAQAQPAPAAPAPVAPPDTAALLAQYEKWHEFATWPTRPGRSPAPRA